MLTISVFDAQGRVLASAPVRSNARRISVRAAAAQRQLDSLYRPGAVAAEIGGSQFKFDSAGRSLFVGFKKES